MFAEIRSGINMVFAVSRTSLLPFLHITTVDVKLQLKKMFDFDY